MKRIHVSGKTLINEDGHEVILNGLCLICRDKSKGYLEPDLPRVLKHYSQLGFNLIRLGIFWDGVEPEPGSYDENYLDRIGSAVRSAEASGMYVFLDMHQDLFSAKFIDGAPAWATLDEGHPAKFQNRTWYESYILSPAVMKAADNFWANSPAEDGRGLLDHYAAMWEHLAGRFQAHSNIIGFEPMNEPYMGSIAPLAFAEGIAAAQAINPSFSIETAATASMAERTAMLDVMTRHFTRFDRETLMPFYNRILQAIRRSGDTPLVLGNNVYGTAVPTGLSPASDVHGRIDHQQIYAPHGYDSVVDTDNYDAYSKENVSRIFNMHREAQDRLDLPVIIGEWGNFPSGSFTNDLIEHMTAILEKNLWHSTYHQYVPGMETDPNYQSLVRGYPMIIAGQLHNYHYDYRTRQLTVEWQARQDEKTVLFHPDHGILTVIASQDGLNRMVIG